MADKPPDGWEKFDIITKAIAGILLPVMIVIVGNWYTSQQQRASDERLKQEKEAEVFQRNADRVTSILNHLASNNPRERKLSLEVLAYLANNQMSDELLNLLISTVNDEDPEIAAAGSAALNQAAASDPEKAKSIVDAATSDPEKAKSIVKAAAAGPNTNTETLIVKAAKSDAAFKSSINSAIESLKNDPKVAQASLRIKAQFAKQ